MDIRTDLVLEESENRYLVDGVETKNSKNGSVDITYTVIKTEKAEKSLKKPKGKYITIGFKGFNYLTDYDEITHSLITALKELLGQINDNIMLVGLGNTDITPDSLGPFVMNKILATRHIKKELAEEIGLKGLKNVSVITPGVLGKTGIEAAELTQYAAEKIKPSAIITVDALAARKPSRLCNTIQLTDTGISPGSGVQNRRKELSIKNMGIPVIAIGVPTVVDITESNIDFYGDKKSENMIVTPNDIDKQIIEAAEIISRALNIFLQPEIDSSLLLNLV